MKDTSITQEYYLCSVGKKGKISSYDTEKRACMIASAILEMKLENCISIDDKKITVISDLPEKISFLKLLYDFIKDKKNAQIEKIAEDYIFTFTDKRLNDLMVAIENSLKGMELLEMRKFGLLLKKNVYVPKREAVSRVIDKIRSEVLEDGKVNDDVVAVIVLLDKSKILKNYFSKFEMEEINNKLKAIAESEEGKMIGDIINHIVNIIVAITTSIIAAN